MFSPYYVPYKIVTVRVVELITQDTNTQALFTRLIYIFKFELLIKIKVICFNIFKKKNKKLSPVLSKLINTFPVLLKEIPSAE